jgi:hypothetical protein
MKRGWPAILAAAALAAGCGSHRPAGGDRDALDYASAYYRGTMTRLLWPRWEPLTRLAARASCRTARMHYRIRDVDAYSAAVAHRAQRVDRRHHVPSVEADLARACASGVERMEDLDR